jgi:hypothetical protein
MYLVLTLRQELPLATLDADPSAAAQRLDIRLVIE